MASLCLKIQVPQPVLRASHQRQKGWKSLGRKRECSRLGTVRLEAVKDGKVQEVLLSQEGTERNWKGWKLQWL